jgi:preprotein translocase subunit SecG
MVSPHLPTSGKVLGKKSMVIAINIVQIIVSVTLIAILLMQMKGEGLGGIFGGDSSVYHQRRGIEATMFNITVALVAIFLLLSLFSAMASKFF